MYYVLLLSGKSPERPRFDWKAKYDLELFLEVCLSNLSAEELRQTLNRDASGKFLERAFQFFFCAAATHALPPSARISPDVGTVSHN